MGVEEGTSTGDTGECSGGLRRLKNKAVDNEGGFGIGKNDVVVCSSGKHEGFQTYKRRRHGKSSSESKAECSETKSEDEGHALVKDDGQMSQQSPLKEPQGGGVNPDPCKQTQLAKDCQDGCSQKSWTVVLENTCTSFNGDEGGMQRCIRDVVEIYPKIGSISEAKEHGHSDENKQTWASPTRSPLNSFHKDDNGNPLTNGHFDGSSQHKITKRWRHAWFNILLSEKFITLRNLLSENFQGFKIESLHELKLINTRMIDGVYDQSPMLFLTDFQQMWDKVKKVGAEMVSLAQSLSDISNSSKQFCSWESDSLTKMEQGEDYSSHKAFTCQCCGNMADGRDCLVCDSCEEMYHVSCIEPAVQEIPSKSWYCSSCSPRSGIQSPHENCVVCDRINASKSAVNGVDNNSSCAEQTHNEFGENSNVAHLSETSKSFGLCKICGTEIRDGENSKTCSHKYCPSKYYHFRCLTKKQLKSYGPGWYCPSCLCRSCLTDKDDDKIVLCDGCDHAFHIYCVKPELTSIPTGKWFCGSCDSKLMHIQKAKKTHEYGNKQKKKGSEGLRAFGSLGNSWNRIGCMEQDKGGGMEMLLTAVNTLNYEEKLAGV